MEDVVYCLQDTIHQTPLTAFWLKFLANLCFEEKKQATMKFFLEQGLSSTVKQGTNDNSSL